MTLQARQASQVGVRELHDRLSHYLQQVAEGTEVLVTTRGKPIAKLVPIGRPDALEELRAAGLLAEPTKDRATMTGRERPSPSRPVAPTVTEQRD